MKKEFWSLIFIYLIIGQGFSVPLPDLLPKDLKEIAVDGDERDSDNDEKDILKRHINSEEEEADPSLIKAYDQLYDMFNPNAKSNYIEESRLKRFPEITEEHVLKVADKTQENKKSQVEEQISRIVEDQRSKRDPHQIEISQKSQVEDKTSRIVEDQRSKRDRHQFEISQKVNEDLVGASSIKSKKDISSFFGSVLPSNPLVELIGALLGSLANFFGGTAAGSLGALNDMVTNLGPTAGTIINPILNLLASAISGLFTLAGSGASTLLSSLGGLFGSHDGGKAAAESLVKGTSTGARLISEIMQSKDEEKKMEDIAKSYLKT